MAERTIGFNFPPTIWLTLGIAGVADRPSDMLLVGTGWDKGGNGASIPCSRADLLSNIQPMQQALDFTPRISPKTWVAELIDHIGS